MKLRLRCNGVTRLVSTNDSPDFQSKKNEIPKLLHLKTIIKIKYHIIQFDVSLNGTDTISENDDVTLQDLGIVSGDLIYVIPSVTSVESENVSSSGHVVTDKECLTRTQREDLEEQMKESNHHFHDDNPKHDNEINRYLYEPMCVCDAVMGLVPESVQLAFTSGPVESEFDALVSILHVLMIEGGYQANPKTPESTSNVSLPPGWKSDKTYQLNYSHISFPFVDFNLRLIPMSSVLVIHGATKGLNKPTPCHIVLKPNLYVKSIFEDISHVYKNLPKLSRIFKDSVAQSLLQQVANVLDIPLNQGLLGLLYEIKLQVLKYLDAPSLCCISRVCSEFRLLAKEPVLWRLLYLRDFGRNVNNDLSQNWYQLYKEKYIQRQHHRLYVQEHRRAVLPPFLGRLRPPVPIPPVYPPGYIGGDYDRDPLFEGNPSSSGHRGSTTGLLFSPYQFDLYSSLPLELPVRRKRRDNVSHFAFGPKQRFF